MVAISTVQSTFYQALENPVDPSSQLQEQSSFYDSFVCIATKCQELYFKFLKCCLPPSSEEKKIEITGKKFFDEIPLDILKTIFFFLPKEDQYQLPQVCSTWRSVFHATPELKSSIYYVNIVQAYTKMNVFNPHYEVSFPLLHDKINQYQVKEENQFHLQLALKHIRIRETKISFKEKEYAKVYTDSFIKSTSINEHIKQSNENKVEYFKKKDVRDISQYVPKDQLTFCIYAVGQKHLHKIKKADLILCQTPPEIWSYETLRELKIEILDASLSKPMQAAIQAAEKAINTCLANKDLKNCTEFTILDADLF